MLRTPDLNTEIERMIKNHKQELWKNFIQENWDQNTNTHIFWQTLIGILLSFIARRFSLRVSIGVSVPNTSFQIKPNMSEMTALQSASDFKKTVLETETSGTEKLVLILNKSNE